jgi:uncharacterized membrane protein (Fun14 family)
VAPSTTVDADDNRNTVTADMAELATTTANDITKRTSHLRCQTWLGALTGHVTWYVANVANRFIGTVTSKVTSCTAIVAGLLIGAISSNVSWLVAVVAEPSILSWKTGIHAITSQVTHLATHMANWIIGALVRKMSRLLTVPTHGWW